MYKLFEIKIFDFILFEKKVYRWLKLIDVFLKMYKCGIVVFLCIMFIVRLFVVIGIVKFNILLFKNWIIKWKKK